MKHSQRITNYLLVLFIIAQVVGLYVIFAYVDLTASLTSGEVVSQLNPIGGTAELEKSTAGITIIGGVIIGTLLVFLIIYFKLFWLWRVWFYTAIVFCLSIAYGAFVHQFTNPIISHYIPIGLAIITGFIKVFKPNFWVHNFTEVFLYGGLIQFFIESITFWNAIFILIAISLYDIYSVWHSGHMVKLANSQAESKLFAGIMIPYSVKEKDFYKQFQSKAKVSKNSSKVEVKNESKTQKSNLDHKKAGKKIVGQSAILGGGDIGFVLLFAGAVLLDTLNQIIAARNLGTILAPIDVLAKMAFLKVLIIPVCAALALYMLFVYSKPDKFYPAMPFLTGGCLVGYFLFRLII